MRWVYTVLIFIAGLFLLLLSLGISLEREKAHKLWAEGAVAEGTVIAILGERRSNAKYYTYTFETAGRVLKQERRRIPWSAASTPIGTKVPVRFDPKEPSKSITRAELDDLDNPGNRFAFPLFGIALVGWALTRAFRPRSTPPAGIP